MDYGLRAATISLGDVYKPTQRRANLACTMACAASISHQGLPALSKTHPSRKNKTSQSPTPPRMCINLLRDEQTYTTAWTGLPTHLRVSIHHEEKTKHPQRPTPPGMCKPTEQTKRGLWLARELLISTGNQPACVFPIIKKKKQNIPRD